VNIRQAPYALRVVQRNAGKAGVLYRRSLDAKQQERLSRIAPLSPLAFAAGAPLLRAAVRATLGPAAKLDPGPFVPLDTDWGARVACYALVAAGLRNATRLSKAVSHLQDADANEAAWWFGLMSGSGRKRAIRALRILVEAVK